MSKLFRKRIVFPIVGVLTFILTFIYALVSAPNVNAATEQLFAELSLSDIISNTNDLGNTNCQGKKGIWFWKGIKSLGSNTLVYHGNGTDYMYFWVSIDEDMVIDNIGRVTRYEWTFSVSSTGTGFVLCGDYSKLNIDVKNGSNSVSDSGFVSRWNMFRFDISHVSSNPQTLSAFNIKLYYTPGAAAKINAGTGVDSVFLSNSNNATTGSNSGSAFDDGSTVYGYAKLKSGYNAQNDWTYIANTGSGPNTSGAIYRIGSKTINGQDVDFGTVNATPKTKTIILDNNGGVGSGSVDLTYGQSAEALGTGFSKESYYFKGWNTKANGTGYNYQTSLSSNNVNSLILNDTSILYAKWIKNMVGDGSEKNPYQIECAEHLEKFRNIVNGINGETKNVNACAVLTRNIDLEGSSDNKWTPIQMYSGTFNGAGYTIKGLYVSATTNNSGLFASVNGGTVKNLTVEGSVTSTGAYCAGIAGVSQNATFINCHNKATVSGSDTNGGICGWATDSSFERCSNRAFIRATGDSGGNLGGIVGAINGTIEENPCTIIDCYNTGTISHSNVNQGGNLGGIVGYTSYKVIVKRCHSVGLISVAEHKWNEALGYIVGHHLDTEVFEDNYYLGTEYKGAGNEDSDAEGEFKALTSLEFMDKNNFATWDFENVWLMGKSYPVTFDTDLWIFGTHVTEDNYSGNGWSYDKDTNTLTLDGFEYAGDGYLYDNFFGEVRPYSSIISYGGRGKLIINLIGDNTLVNTTTDNNLILTVIYSSGQLEFVGTGSLHVAVDGEGDSSYAIASKSAMTINGPTIEAIAGNAVYSSVGVNVCDANLDIISGSLSAIGAECSNAYGESYGIDVSDETITIGEAAKSFIASGYTGAIYAGNVINAIPGFGYTDVLGQEDETEIEISQEATVDGFKYVTFIGYTPEDVIDLIDEIGNVDYTDTTSRKIKRARTAYNCLDSSEQAQITNYNKLLAAEEIYNNVDNVVGKINAIGEVEYKEESKALIDAARSAYDALTKAQKALVPNLDTLVAKEAEYKAFDDQYNADQVEILINNIGEVEYKEESKALIDAARSAYDALNDEAKALVENIDTLIAAEKIYGIMDLVTNLDGDMYNEEAKEALIKARNDYDSLDIDQKALITNYDGLLKLEEDYEAIETVVNEINNIGNITYDKESLDKIQNAKESKDLLTSDQKNIFPTTESEKLNNYEVVYQVLVVIYNLGEVEYTEECRSEIEAARAAYNELTSDQKELINNNDLKLLTDKEDEFNSKDTTATVWGIILLLLVIAALVSGCYFIYKLSRKYDNKVKASSTALPLVILSSYFAGGPYLAFYIILPFAVVVWVAVLVIYIMKERDNNSNSNKVVKTNTEDNKEALEMVKASNGSLEDSAFNKKDLESFEEDNKDEDTDFIDDEEVVETRQDENGDTFKIQYVSSFTAKLIQSSDELKKQYSELRKYVLSYSGTKSKITWHFESINYGKDSLLRFAIRGKTLCVYYNLDFNEFENSKYKVENVSSKKYSKVPCLYRIKNDRRYDYAKELIDILAKKYNLSKGENEIEDIILPYEERDALVEKGLVKKTETKIATNK